MAPKARPGSSSIPAALPSIDLPPGTAAIAEFTFRDTVRLGGRGHHFAIDVTGGLGGLLLDMRDVPLRLPDRADLRGELLETWRVAVAGSRRLMAARPATCGSCPHAGW